MKRSLLSSNSGCLQSKDVHRLISEQMSHLLSDAIKGYFWLFGNLRENARYGGQAKRL